jgi:FemAB-related protein (PEP-CTERM system-associated)
LGCIAVTVPTLPTVQAERASVEWDQYVARTPGATICHLSGWLDSVERTWGHPAYRLVARRAERVVGVLPLMHVSSRLFGSMLVSTPAAIYGGPLGDDSATCLALVAEAKRLSNQLQVSYLELREPRCIDRASEDPGFVRQDLYVAFERPLPSNPDTLLDSLPKKVRYQIRRATQLGLSTTRGRADQLDAFYAVYAANMRNLGTPVYPKRLFSEFLRAFPDASDILIVRRGEQVAGATLNFYFGDTVLPHYGCAYAQFHPTGVSAFMYWKLMQAAAERGYRQFDFGRSKLGSGSYAFKRGWRMHERPLPYRYLLIGRTRMPNLNPTNPRFRLAIRLWKHLPLHVTNLLGPMVVRNIP